MRTEREIKIKLRVAEVNLRQAQERFDEYDNHDDLEEIEKLRREVDTLKWILKSS
jgi:hypothetical protein